MADQSSVQTTFMARENAVVQRHEQQKQDEAFCVMARELQNYDLLQQELDEVLVLKETIRAQAAEIDRLNAESNDYSSRVAGLAKERDDALFGRQVTETQVAEQKVMIGKLLHAIQGPIGGGLVQEVAVPHNFSRRQALGFMGRVERTTVDSDKERADCGECCVFTRGFTRNAQSNDYVDQNEAELRNDVAPAKIANLEARISALIAERDGIEALLSKRIASLQASLTRMRETLSQQLQKAEESLNGIQKDYVKAVREKSETDKRCLRLESDMALLAAKGAAAAQKARDAANSAVRNAKREVKQFQLNKDRGTEEVMKQLKLEYNAEMKKLRGEIAALQREGQEKDAKVALVQQRNAALEKRLRELSHENAHVRHALENRLK